MHRLALILLLAALPLGGCLKALGVDCEDECSADRCNLDVVEVCSYSFVIGCYVYSFEEDCGDRGAVCVAEPWTASIRCECPAGLVDCGVCVDTATDPANCGGCGVPCTGTCMNGWCNP